jgi:predicted Rdx family selenoprotein
MSTYTCSARRREVCFPEVRELRGLVRIWIYSSNLGTASVSVVNQVAAVLGGRRREVCFPEVRELHGLVRIWIYSSSDLGTVSVAVVNQVTHI